MAGWDVDKWDIGVWDAIPSSGHRSTGGGARRRRPNEKVVWYDDWVQSKTDKELPKPEKIKVVKEAIRVVKSYRQKSIPVVDAKAAILRAKNAADILSRVGDLEALMAAYIAIQSERQVMRRDDQFVILTMLGVL
jgi:hypothetical protein|tara:strand:- start:3386 stop:3790 length:405 start_codon:yes stop_codon:yes gene_type:complete